MGDLRRGPTAASQRSEHGRLPGRDRDTVCTPRPTRSSSPARSIPARSSGSPVDPGSVDPEPAPTTPAHPPPPSRRRHRPGRPARLRRADHPPAARQAAPPRRRRPARAAGLGTRARRPAAVRDHAQQPDRRGRARGERASDSAQQPSGRPPTERSAASGDEPAPNSAERRGPSAPSRARSPRGWTGWAPCGWRASSPRSPRGRARAPRSSSCATPRPTCRCSSPPRSGWSGDGGAAVAEGNRVVVHGKPSFFLGRGTSEPARRHDPRGRHRRAAGPHRASARSCWPRRGSSTSPASAVSRSCPAASG